MNEQTSRKSNLTPFWILLAVCGLPYLLSWLYFANQASLPELKTGNRGELIEPVRPVTGLELSTAEGTILQTDNFKGNWILLSAGKSDCKEACQKNIYFMRQIRRLMGEERTRIKRLFLLMDNEKQNEFVENVKQYGEMDIITSDTQGKQALLKLMTLNGQSPENRLFIIDPAANLMMSYPQNIDPEDVAKDFRRLLKVVRIGEPKKAG